MRVARVAPLVFSTIMLLFAAPFVTPGYAQGEDDQIVLHGYFSQAFAKSDNLSILGIPKGGTWNYRVLALQARYLITDKDQLIIQARYQQSGTSPLNDQSPEILWAYYQHTFDNFTVAIGKAPFPFGIYNNTREVGTLLPFYRAPANYYINGYQTIEGVVLTNASTFGTWRLESTVYAGAVTVPYVVPTSSGPVVGTSRTEFNYGTQFWLETPLRGLRLGAQVQSYQIVDAATGTDTTRQPLFGGSVDWTGNRFFARAEYLRWIYTGSGPTGQDQVEYDGYAESGVKVTDQFSINTQVTQSTLHYPGRTYRGTYDRAIGISYAPNADVIFKLEGHRTTGYFFDQPPLVTGPPGKTNYGIASVSTSF